MLAWVPKVALYLGDDGTHCSEERSQSHFITVPRVNRLSSFRENQEMLADLVKLFHIVLYLDLKRLRIDVFSFEEKLDRIYLWCQVALSWLVCPFC